MKKGSTKVTKNERREMSLTWQGAERPPRKRWWWFIAFGYAAVALGGVLIATGQSLFAGALGLAAVAVLLVYTGKPRKVEARLTDEVLTVNGQHFPLANYRGFQVSDDAGELVLVPTRTARLRVVVPLPGDQKEMANVLEALEKHLPLEEAHPTLFDRLARWMKLS